ncbi:membrane-associating domain-containing protein [Pyrenochaeta sp. MPI-SDFR-AT-0127]|nr:membrane-associating domain-containing protein [Pyrenochaeta sp. MPI-SDFR-AT-0127]
MALSWIHPVRGAQAVLAIVVLGLMAYVSSWWTTHWRQMSPSEVNFLIFTPAWSIVAVVPLVVIPLRFNHLLSSPAARYGFLALEGLTMLFWFGGFVSMAVFLSDRICFGTVCDVARASTAISAVSWVVWAVTFVFGVIGVVKGGDLSFRKKAVVVDKEVDMHQGV